MKLSIIVPVYNEEQTIARVLSKLLEINLPCEREIIVINDGSTDRTVDEVHTILAKRNGKHIRFINHQKNSGKGKAVKSGFEAATGEYILIQDADFEYNPEEIYLLIKPLKNRVNIGLAVYGSRFLNGYVKMPPIYVFGNKFLTLLTNLIYGITLTDMETGYKLLPQSFVKTIHIHSNHFDFEPEITAKLVRNGIRIVEVPISYQGRTHLAGKKLTPMDALEAIKALFYYRFFS